MRPEPGQVLHFSEDPTIRRFVPHVAATARQPDAYVWAVDHDRAPDYWFPRQCPRAMAWVRAGTTDADRVRIIGAGCGERVHAIEYGWLEAIRTVRLFAYRLPDDRFRPLGAPDPHAQVAVEPVEPLGPPEPVGDLLECHAEAGIQLRVLTTCGRSGTPWSPARSGSAASGYATQVPAPYRAAPPEVRRPDPGDDRR